MTSSTTPALISISYTVKEAGYAFLYVSNEDPTFTDVFFDDVSMRYTPSNVVQYNEYYPFGLQTQESWRRTSSSNNFLYNGGAELNASSGWDDTFFRGYDPALGRFHQVDPLAASTMSLNPYHFAANNPALLNDPNGDRLPTPLWLLGEDDGTSYTESHTMGDGGAWFAGWASSSSGGDDLFSETSSPKTEGSSVLLLDENGEVVGILTTGADAQGLFSIVQANSGELNSGFLNTLDFNQSGNLGFWQTVVSGNLGNYTYAGADATTQLGQANVGVKFVNLKSASPGSSGNGSGWLTSAASATLAFISTDVAVPEPTDAAWPKWAAYAVAGGATLAILHYADKGNPNYPGPWTTTKPDPTVPFYNSSGNSSYESGDPEGLPPGIGAAGGALIGLKLIEDYMANQQYKAPQDATKYVVPTLGPK